MWTKPFECCPQDPANSTENTVSAAGYPKSWWALTSRSWVKIPIHVRVLEHRNGMVLFDSGLNPATTYPRNYFK